MIFLMGGISISSVLMLFLIGKIKEEIDQEDVSEKAMDIKKSEKISVTKQFINNSLIRFLALIHTTVKFKVITTLDLE